MKQHKKRLSTIVEKTYKTCGKWNINKNIKTSRKKQV